MVTRHRVKHTGISMVTRHRVKHIGIAMVTRHRVKYTGIAMVTRHRVKHTGIAMVTRHRVKHTGIAMVTKQRVEHADHTHVHVLVHQVPMVWASQTGLQCEVFSHKHTYMCTCIRCTHLCSRPRSPS